MSELFEYLKKNYINELVRCKKCNNRYWRSTKIGDVVSDDGLCIDCWKRK